MGTKVKYGNLGWGRSYKKTGESCRAVRGALGQWEILGWKVPALAVWETVQDS